MTKKLSVLFCMCVIGGLLMGQMLPYANYLPQVSKQKNRVIVRINPQKGNGVYYLYYRAEGSKNFQVRKMQAEDKGVYSYPIVTENLYGRNIEYFIVEKRANGPQTISVTHTIANFTEKASPEIYFQSAETSLSPGARREPILSATGSLSTSTKLSDNSENPGQNYTANGNLRIYKNIVDNDLQFDFDTNFSHIDPFSDTEKRINLSSMMIRFKKGSMQFEVGDVSVNATEFSTSYLNRRGLRYEMNGQTLYLSSFYTNSQQKTGFDGFGIPASGAGIFGAVAGFNLKSTLKVRGMFMTGNDNLDSKTVYSSENPYRSGQMFSLWGEMNLLKNRLQLLGEFSSSNFGSAADKASLQKEKDSAWQAGLRYNHGILSVNGDYKKIGDRFNSIANLFLQNDREGLNSTIGLNIKTFSLNIGYTDQKNYMHSVVQDMLHQKKISSSFNWGIGTHFRLGGEVSRDNLDYDSSTGLQTSSSDMNTNNYMASLGYMAGSNGINLNIGKTESVNFTSNLNGSLAVNLRFGQFMSLNPSLSYQSNKNLSDDSTSTIYNFYLNSELTFIPQYFTLTLSGSYMNSKNQGNTSTNWTAGVNLNFFAAKLFKNKIQPALALKSQFQGSQYGDTKVNTAIFFLQADISF